MNFTIKEAKILSKEIESLQRYRRENTLIKLDDLLEVLKKELKKHRKESNMDKILEKLKKEENLAYFIDAGYELTIYKKDTEIEIYEGTIFDFIEMVMKELKIKDDN